MSEKVTFDAAISTAFLQLQQQTLSAIPDLALLSAAFSPSPALVNKTDAIIYMAERKQKRATRLKYIARTAAALIIAFTLLSASALSKASIISWISSGVKELRVSGLFMVIHATPFSTL